MPPEERFVQAHGTTTHLYQAGQGPVLLLLHGLGGAALSWLDTLEHLSRRFTVVAPDLPGHGQSDAPPWTYHLDHAAHWINDLLDALSVPTASLVGNSLGGLIAAWGTLAHPQRVHRLVLVGSAGLGREIGPLLRLLSLPGVGEVLGRPRRWTLRRVLKGIVFNPNVITDNLFEALWRERSQPGRHATVLQVLRIGVDIRGVKPSIMLLDKLPHITAPTLLIWGDRDPIFPVSHARSAARLLPNATLVVFPQCGHWPPVEYPHEFARVVTEFLDGQEPRPPA